MDEIFFFYAVLPIVVGLALGWFLLSLGSLGKKPCPHCKLLIPQDATTCGHCRADLVTRKRFVETSEQVADAERIAALAARQAQLVQELAPKGPRPPSRIWGLLTMLAALGAKAPAVVCVSAWAGLLTADRMLLQVVGDENRIVYNFVRIVAGLIAVLTVGVLVWLVLRWFLAGWL